MAQAWDTPNNWAEIGTVRQWQATDARFYRIQETALYLDKAQLKLNQKKEYAKTFRLRGRLPGIGLAAWQELDETEQAERSRAARRELKFVIDFRNRVLHQAQDLRQTGTSGWGAVVGDQTVIGDALTRLFTAVNIDPSNPYAWHLYSYFATVVGDDVRALRALRGAERALAVIPDDALRQLRADVALDRAWLLRDQGEFAAAHTSLETVAANGGKGLESRLLQGLLAAQMGDDQLAITIASELRQSTVRLFPPNLRSSDFAPDVGDISAWKKSRSSYLSDWILAYTWLRDGRVDLARSALGTYRMDTQRPFAQRFWREAGQIYEVTGSKQMALQAWTQARIALPYYPYTVYKSYAASLTRLTGRPGGLPYLLGFDSNFLSGSRLAYGADLVAQLAAATDPAEKEKLAAQALDELEVCERFGVYPGQAAILQGQVFYLMNDLISARQVIEGALVVMNDRGDMEGTRAVLRGLNQAQADLGPLDIAHFYGQSGISQGRWQGDRDPAATLATLRAAYAAGPSDENRRGLARVLVRSGEIAEGRSLALAALRGAAVTSENITALDAADIELVLEADRVVGDSQVALMMVAVLQSGSEEPWLVANVWALAGFICLDDGLLTEGKVALERASTLDPGNHGLQVQLSSM